MTGNHLRALQNSRAMRAEAIEMEANLQPTPFDEALPINTAQWWHGETQLPRYIDQAEDRAEPIDFRELAMYVYTRRTLAMKRVGMRYDPIDDGPWIPDYNDIAGFMRADQVEKHFTELLTAGVDKERMFHQLSPDFVENNQAYLEELGMPPRAIRKTLGKSAVRAFFQRTNR